MWHPLAVADQPSSTVGARVAAAVRRAVAARPQPPAPDERPALERRIHKLERAVHKARREAWKDESPRLVDLDYPAAHIVIDASTKLARKRKNATSKEPRTVEWIESLPAGAVLYDVGANVGAYSLIGALRPQGALEVLAFEPAFATYAVLCRNVVHNAVEAHVMPLPITLGETTKLGSFGYHDLAAGAALHGGLYSTETPAYEQPVLVFALDDLIETFALTPPNHLKLDVDGAELEVLRGATATFADSALQSVLVELSQRYEEEVDAFMSGHGLTGTDRLRGGQAGGEPFLYALYER